MSPRGKKQNERMREDALAKITRAALEVFAEYGFHGATMKQIAKATGLSYGIVYHYFPSKAGIFIKLTDFALDASLAGMRAILGGSGTAWQRIEAYSAMVLKSMFEGETALYFLIMHQAMSQGKGVPGLTSRLDRKLALFYETFTPVITAAQRAGNAAPGDPIALAAAYFSLVQGLATLPFQRRGLERMITPDMLTNILRNPTKSE